MSDLADLTVAEASALLAGGAVSSVDLVRATLRRMDETEPVLHAYAHRFDDRALADAAAADAAPRRGPLHGVPFAVKDTLDTAGTPTEAGSASLRGRIGARDSTVVGHLLAAGAVLVGKHVTHEFAQGQEEAATRNPWAPDRFAGGSSAGSGASVAAGSSMLAVGTDAGGSTRMPAALTGVVGFKPTYGRISTSGTLPGAAVPCIEHIGLFTRTVADLRLVLPAVCRPDPHDPRTLDFPPYTDEPADVRGLRVGVLRRVAPGQAVEPDVLAALDGALARLSELGVTPVELDLDLTPAGPAAALLVAAAAAAPHLPALRRGGAGIRPEVKAHLQAGLLIPAAHVHAARAVRTAVRRQVARTFRAHRLDAVATPTLPCPPPLLGRFRPVTDMGPLTAFASVWNLTGQPAVSVPMAPSPAGLPVGVQLVGRPLGEARIVRLGSALQPAPTRPPEVRP